MKIIHTFLLLSTFAFISKVANAEVRPTSTLPTNPVITLTKEADEQSSSHKKVPLSDKSGYFRLGGLAGINFVDLGTVKTSEMMGIVNYAFGSEAVYGRVYIATELGMYHLIYPSVKIEGINLGYDSHLAQVRLIFGKIFANYGYPVKAYFISAGLLGATVIRAYGSQSGATHTFFTGGALFGGGVSISIAHLCEMGFEMTAGFINTALDLAVDDLSPSTKLNSFSGIFMPGIFIKFIF